jgi:hypothetical protein
MLSQDGLLLALFRGLIALAAVVLPIYVIYSLFSAKGRRRLLVNIIIIVLLFAVAEELRTHKPEFMKDQQEQQLGGQQNDIQPGNLPPAPVFTADPPQWLSIVVILVASLIVASVVVAVAWKLRNRPQDAPVALERLAEEAQKTIISLQAGDDFRETILRCYRDMSRILEQERGVKRERAMTPREFEMQLLDRGLPQEAIRTLTRLFEQVRYGHVSVGTRETDLALSSLTTIAAACHTAGIVHE